MWLCAFRSGARLRSLLGFPSLADMIATWRKYRVWVGESESASLGEKAAGFHGSLSPRDVVDLQHACREPWKEWLWGAACRGVRLQLSEASRGVVIEPAGRAGCAAARRVWSSRIGRGAIGRGQEGDALSRNVRRAGVSAVVIRVAGMSS